MGAVEREREGATGGAVGFGVHCGSVTGADDSRGFAVAGWERGGYKAVVAFRDLGVEDNAVRLLQRSLGAGRVGHAYLFTGDESAALMRVARSFAQALLCDEPLGPPEEALYDACNECSSCRRVEHGTHPDVHWVRPESKLRVITIDQVRELSREIFLKPHEGKWKVGVIVEADCLNAQAANALLKTLEEPPDRSVLVLLTTQPGRLLDTILSRCLRVRLASATPGGDAARVAWVERFAAEAVRAAAGFLERYRLVDLLLQQLETAREEARREVARALEGSRMNGTGSGEEEGEESGAEPLMGGGRSGGEEKAALEAEYRRRREELLSAILRWWRDVWVLTWDVRDVRLFYPGLPATVDLARRLRPADAVYNLHVWESLQATLRRTNVQELLALETAVLQLRLGRAPRSTALTGS